MPSTDRSIGWTFALSGAVAEARLQQVARTEPCAWLVYSVDHQEGEPLLRGLVHFPGERKRCDVDGLLAPDGLGRLDIQRGSTTYNLKRLPSPLAFEHGIAVAYDPPYDVDEIASVVATGLPLGSFLRNPYLAGFYLKSSKIVRQLYASRPAVLPCPDIALVDWQIETLRMLERPPTPRTIHFYVDVQGRAGKTTFARYLLACVPNACLVHPCGRAALTRLMGQTTRILIMDVPRASRVPYATLEAVKGGAVRANTQMHVLVFCTAPPARRSPGCFYEVRLLTPIQ